MSSPDSLIWVFLFQPSSDEEEFLRHRWVLATLSKVEHKWQIRYQSTTSTVQHTVVYRTHMKHNNDGLPLRHSTSPSPSYGIIHMAQCCSQQLCRQDGEYMSPPTSPGSNILHYTGDATHKRCSRQHEREQKVGWPAQISRHQ